MRQSKLSEFLKCDRRGTLQRLAFNDHHWQIIQFVPSSQNGQVFAWVLVNKKMYKVLINVPLGDPEMEEIYGPKLSLDINFILNVQIGCVCEVKPSAKKHKRDTKDAWNLTDLQINSTMKGSYLESYSYFCLYSSTFDDRGAYLVCCPSLSTIHAVFVTAELDEQFDTMLTPDILGNLFRQACQRLSVKPPAGDAITFEVKYVANHNEAGEILERIISGFGSKLCEPAIAVIASQGVDSPKLGIRIPALNDFPCVNLSHILPTVEADIIVQDHGWQTLAAECAMNGCVLSSSVFHKNILLSRFAEIPAGNIGPDRRIQTSDVLFARALRDKAQKLWTSEYGRDNEVNEPVVVACDVAYRNVTVELKIKYLAIEALQSEYANDLTSGPQPSSLAICVLQELTEKWIDCANSQESVYAHELLEHLYGWICSPRSKLHDPALLRTLHKVMNKMLSRLLRELSFCKIIFINYSKVIFDTGLPYVSDTKMHCLDSLQFEYIELEPTQFLCSLLFMDEYNYGGIKFKETHAVDTSDSDDDPQVEIVSRWKIAENLPKETQDHFLMIVSDYLYLRWKFAQNYSHRGDVRDDVFQSLITEHLRDQIETLFTRKLLIIVSDIVLHGREKDKSLALEFIKHVCAVLELDKNVQHDVEIMRKNLLKLVHEREFACGSFSFTLPNVICSHCNSCRDIDLLGASASLSQEWKCSFPQCGQPYDRVMMQSKLLELLNRSQRIYHFQGFICLECDRIKSAHMAGYRGCAGFYGHKESATVFRSKMDALLNIAVHLRFDILEERVYSTLNFAFN